jgi:serine/threonine-protein kinase
MGTPNYMSPEQATGMVEEIDHRADQWALACIAWQMLLGRGPFVADEVAAILYQIINLDPHPLAPRVPGLPPAVETVLRRALSKRPAERFASIREFSCAFEAAASGRPADATPAPVSVPTTAPADATIGYGGTPVSRAPARAPAAHVLRDGRKPDADPSQVDDEPVRAAPWRRIKPIHAVIATAGVLLLFVAFLLIGKRRADMRPSPTPVAAPRPTLLPAASHRPAPIPIVTPLPDPTPPPPAAVAPEPAPPEPTLGWQAKAPAARRPQPATAARPNSAAGSAAVESFDVDKFLREHDWHDPFEDDTYVLPTAKQPKKPVSPAATKPPEAPKPEARKPALIEEI